MTLLADVDLQQLAVTAIVSALGGGGIAAILTAYLKGTRDFAHDNQQFTRGLIDRMEKRIASVEAGEKACLAAKEQMAKRVGELESEVRARDERIDDMCTRLEEAERQLHQLKNQ